MWITARIQLCDHAATRSGEGVNAQQVDRIAAPEARLTAAQHPACELLKQFVRRGPKNRWGTGSEFRARCIESKWRTSLLTMTSAPPVEANAIAILRIAALPDRLSRFDRTAATTTMSRICWRRWRRKPIKLRAENDVVIFVLDRLRKKQPIGVLTARSSPCSGRLFTLTTAETKVEASKTTLKLYARRPMPQAPHRCPHP